MAGWRPGLGMQGALATASKTEHPASPMRPAPCRTTVDAVADGHVHEAVQPGKRHRRLRARLGQRAQLVAGAASQDHDWRVCGGGGDWQVRGARAGSRQGRGQGGGVAPGAAAVHMPRRAALHGAQRIHRMPCMARGAWRMRAPPQHSPTTSAESLKAGRGGAGRSLPALLTTLAMLGARSASAGGSGGGVASSSGCGSGGGTASGAGVGAGVGGGARLRSGGVGGGGGGASGMRIWRRSAGAASGPGVPAVRAWRRAPRGRGAARARGRRGAAILRKGGLPCACCAGARAPRRAAAARRRRAPAGKRRGALAVPPPHLAGSVEAAQTRRRRGGGDGAGSPVAPRWSGRLAAQGGRRAAEDAMLARCCLATPSDCAGSGGLGAEITKDGDRARSSVRNTKRNAVEFFCALRSRGGPHGLRRRAAAPWVPRHAGGHPAPPARPPTAGRPAATRGSVYSAPGRP
jgi:hypothetical protein